MIAAVCLVPGGHSLCLSLNAKPVVINLWGLRTLDPITPAGAMYKQLGEVGGVPRLTSAVSRFLFVWHLGRKISQRPSYPRSLPR